jgi:hypothetical protein
MEVMKRLRFIVPLLVAAFVFSGCNIIKVNPKRDGAQVVATVYGEDITKKQVYDVGAQLYAQKQIQYKWTGTIDSWNIETIKADKEQVLEEMIDSKVLLHVAKEKGFYTFTTAEQKPIDDAVASYKSLNYDNILANYTEQVKEDPTIDPVKAADADIEAYRQRQADSIAYDKLQKSITDPVLPKDADVLAEYNSELSSERTSYVTNPTQAVTDENGTTQCALIFPADGYFRVRQILIPLPQDIQDQLSTYRSTQTTSDSASADALRTAELLKIKATADRALADAKAANGDLAKLDQLIKTYGNNDPGMDSKPEGYLLVAGTSAYVQEFTDAALALKDIGVPSELAATDFGYHIIWITQKITKGTTVPYEQAKEKLTQIVTATQKDTAWQNAGQGWLSDASSQIQRHIDRLNN